MERSPQEPSRPQGADSALCFVWAKLETVAWEWPSSLARSPEPQALVPTGHTAASGALTEGAASPPICNRRV